MRGAGVGLIGLLLCAGIILYMMWGGGNNPGSVRPALEAREKTKEMTNALSGRDTQGAAVTESITYESTGKGVIVKTVVVGGALEKKFGLKPGDVIVELGPITADQFAGSDGAARDFMQAQYGRTDSWTVVRNGQKIRLPEDRNTPAAGAPVAPANPNLAQPAPTPAAPSNAAPSNEPRTNPRNQAQDLRKKIESH